MIHSVSKVDMLRIIYGFEICGIRLALLANMDGDAVGWTLAHHMCGRLQLQLGRHVDLTEACRYCLDMVDQLYDVGRAVRAVCAGCFADGAASKQSGSQH